MEGRIIKASLSRENIAAIEKVLNKGGSPEALIKVEHGKVIILQVEKKKITAPPA